MECYESPQQKKRNRYYEFARAERERVAGGIFNGQLRDRSGLHCPLSGGDCQGRRCVAARIKEAVWPYDAESELLAEWECTAFPKADRRVDAERDEGERE